MKLYKSFLIVLSTLLIMNCNSNNDEQLMEKAKELSQKFIITDGHIDTPWRMHKWGYEDISKRSPGDFDYVRAKEGGLDVPFMAIYVPATYQVTGGAKEKAEELIAIVERIVSDHPDKFEIAHSPEEAERIVSEGKIALPMGMENGAPSKEIYPTFNIFMTRALATLHLRTQKITQFVTHHTILENVHIMV